VSRLGKARFAREQRGALWLIICARVPGTIFEGGLPDRSPIWSHLARGVYSILVKEHRQKSRHACAYLDTSMRLARGALAPLAVCCFIYM
jgi:hypothetical protein